MNVSEIVIPSAAKSMEHATIALGGMDNKRTRPKFVWLWDEAGDLFTISPDEKAAILIHQQHRGLTPGSLADTVFRGSSHNGNVFLLQNLIQDELHIFHSTDGKSAHSFSIFTSGIISADAWCNEECSQMMIVVLTLAGLEWWIKDFEDDILELKYRQDFGHEYRINIPQDPSAIVKLNPEGLMNAFILGENNGDVTLTHYNGIESNQLLNIKNGRRPKQLRPALTPMVDDTAKQSPIEFAIGHGGFPKSSWEFFVFDPQNNEFKIQTTYKKPEYDLYSYLFPKEMINHRYIAEDEGEVGVKTVDQGTWVPVFKDSIEHPLLLDDSLCGISKKGDDWILLCAPLEKEIKV